MAVRDYMTANLAMRGRAARKTLVRISQEPDTTQHISVQKLVFMKRRDPNNVIMAK